MTGRCYPPVLYIPMQEPKPSLVLYVPGRTSVILISKQKHFTVIRHRRGRLRRGEILTFILYTLLTACRQPSLVLYIPGRNQNSLSSCTSSCRTLIFKFSNKSTLLSCVTGGDACDEVRYSLSSYTPC